MSKGKHPQSSLIISHIIIANHLIVDVISPDKVYLTFSQLWCRLQIIAHVICRFREDINLAVLQLRESGDLQKLQKKWWFDKGECNAEAEGKVINLRIIN